MCTRRSCRSSPVAARAARGFTMVELLTVVSILAVIVGVRGAVVQRVPAAQQAKALSYDLTGDLMLARNEALKRNASVPVIARAAPAGRKAGACRLGQRRRVAQHAATRRRSR